MNYESAAPGTAVEVEATGNWHWILEEIETVAAGDSTWRAGCVPRLVHPRKAKVPIGMINKTDKLDVHGLNRLQRAGTLPTVWIPPGRLRDLRELTRGRMVLAAIRSARPFSSPRHSRTSHFTERSSLCQSR